MSFHLTQYLSFYCCFVYSALACFKMGRQDRLLSRALGSLDIPISPSFGLLPLNMLDLILPLFNPQSPDKVVRIDIPELPEKIG